MSDHPSTCERTNSDRSTFDVDTVLQCITLVPCTTVLVFGLYRPPVPYGGTPVVVTLPTRDVVYGFPPVYPVYYPRLSHEVRRPYRVRFRDPVPLGLFHGHTDLGSTPPP